MDDEFDDDFFEENNEEFGSDSEESSESENIKKMMQDLITALNRLYSKSQEIHSIISEFEEEGYNVDVFMAYLTRLTRKDAKNPQRVEFKLNSYDLKFLENIKVRHDDFPDSLNAGENEGS